MALRGQLADAEARIRSLENRLRDGETRDPRTRLLSNDAFVHAAERALALATAEGRPVTAAIIDVDGFRRLNVRCGPQAGDAVLVDLVARVRSLTRSYDVLGRSGADEITILMPGTDQAGAQARCDRLIRDLKGCERPGVGVVTVSAGVAALIDGGSLAELLGAAQAGLERARALGGARSAVRLADEVRDANPAHAAVVEAIAMTLLERDRYTGEHSAAVVELSRRVAMQLGLDEREVEQVAAAALLHDIGKVAMPDRILNKPGALDEREWALMREHPIVGERILRAIPGMGAVARIVRHEHESFDGTGYPDGLVGDAIPIGSRIILACDTYSAITTARAYRPAQTHHFAITELTRCAGAQFDPRVTEALIGCLYWDAQQGHRAGTPMGAPAPARRDEPGAPQALSA
ncbi:MAG TPA: diguanylate cyclase [Solirubrobacteraceae bacterium]